MNKVPHAHMPTDGKLVYVSFRAEAEWRRQIAMWCSEHGVTIQDLCIHAVGKVTGIRHGVNNAKH